MNSERSPAVIEPGCLYSKQELCERMGIGEKTWKDLIREGLPVARVGQKGFVFAEDLFEFIRRRKQ